MIIKQNFRAAPHERGLFRGPRFATVAPVTSFRAPTSVANASWAGYRKPHPRPPDLASDPRRSVQWKAADGCLPRSTGGVVHRFVDVIVPTGLPFRSRGGLRPTLDGAM